MRSSTCEQQQTILRCAGHATHSSYVGAVIPVILAGAILLVLVSPDLRCVLAPMLAVITVFVWLVATIWDRDHAFPVCDVGCMCALATVVYSVVPVLNYIAGGLRFTALGDMRLYRLQPTPSELGAFHWWHVAYLSSFAVVYVLVRGNTRGGWQPLQLPEAVTQRFIVVLLASLLGYFLLLRVATGANYFLSYKDMRAAIAAGTQLQLPLIIEQISRKLLGWLFICKLALVIIITTRLHRQNWRLILFLWLGMEVLLSITRMGSRTWTILLLLGTAILYHRLVKPLSPKFCAISGSLLLTGFLAFGAIRGGIIEKVDGCSGVPVASASNEFQALLSTGYDLRCRVKEGLEVPLQVYFADFLQLIPRQICPVQKIDPSLWYLEVIDCHSGSGFMFGVLGQAAVGFGIWELVLRGALLGFILAKIHRWYVLKHSSCFLATLFYVWLCTRVYYTFRASTFYFVTFIVYQVIPVFLLIQLPEIARSFSRGIGRRRPRVTSV